MTSESGRPNQRSRTRKELLRAAARLLKNGGKPSLDEVATEALVSRATAYRYFPSIDALLVEAALDIGVPDAAELFGADAPKDVVRRVELVDDALSAMMRDNEASLRAMLASSLTQPRETGLPARQNRRTPLIEAALEPLRDTIPPARIERLSSALALIIGTEAMVVFKDVLDLGEREAEEVRRWAIGALIAGAIGAAL